MKKRTARRIKPIKGRHYRWKVPLLKNNNMIHCESRLERNFVRLLDFDREVLQVESQPVGLLYCYKGKERKYYPDFKVITSDGHIRIVEVKPKSMTQKPENIMKFIIGRMYCDLQGWDYHIVTEEQIFRGYIQENLDKLRAMGNEWTEYNDLVYVLHSLQNTGDSTIEMLQSNCTDLDESTFYKCIYKLIYHQKVYADLFATELSEGTMVSIQIGEEN
ncbi:TnsA endonuclease N-terminal domain-containing protein [Paenibacillus sp. FSL H8-0537]|uniref:TnsA endonuclease N-terminal domain-containing protein n=1 Tax=Paenibacillus sp. FSL H8-0537 TaxID=2921399 RepID=UPI0031013516